jgi:GT2 family glycosyltransferase
MSLSSPKKSKSPLVYIVVLNWNGWRDTLVCLRSLEALDYDNWRVVVVDNASTDDSIARIQENFPTVEPLSTDLNLGFSGGNNVGIRFSLSHDAEYVWLLNNDTTVDPNALRAMVAKAVADPNIGAVGCAIYYASDPARLQVWGGGRVNFWLGRSRGFLRPESDSKLEFLSGASLLLRRAAVESIGLLDEEFFFYWEDTDYSFRLRKAEWELAVAGDSKVWHKESASVGKTSTRLDVLFNTSAARFFEKHASAPRASFWVGVTLRVLKRIILGRWNNAWAACSATRQARSVLSAQPLPNKTINDTFQPRPVSDVSTSFSNTQTNK